MCLDACVCVSISFNPLTPIHQPEPLRNLSDLVAAQLAFFKEGFETLSALGPEVDELQVTQEALFRSS